VFRMTRRQIALSGAGVVVAATLAGGGAVAFAGAGDDEKLVGENADRAAAAAIAHLRGGEAIGVELDREGARTYEVEVRTADGRVIEVDLDDRFTVIRAEDDAGESEGQEEGESEGDGD
jgi:hypothetical protein